MVYESSENNIIFTEYVIVASRLFGIICRKVVHSFDYSHIYNILNVNIFTYNWLFNNCMSHTFSIDKQIFITANLNINSPYIYLSWDTFKCSGVANFCASQTGI